MLTAHLPPRLEAALGELGSSSPVGAAGDLSRRYRERDRRGPVARSGEDVAAYAATRLPATYAAVSVALRELHARDPGFAPASQLDLGAGTGAAVWAAAGLWDSICEVVAVEAEDEMARLGRALEPPVPVSWVRGALPRAIPEGRFDLVTISYVLNELDDREQREVVERAWEAAEGVLVLVEPGTPDGYRRVVEARDRLLGLGGTTVAPCPHDRVCPLRGTADWCHFAVRLARSRAHRLAKDARLGYEDEKFSYAVVSRRPAEQAESRILRHPQVRPGHVHLVLCEAGGVREAVVSKRDGALFRRARKASWGEDLGGQ